MRNARAEDTGLPQHVSQKNAVIKDGATIMSQATGACLHCPMESESGQISVIDPVGAGDTFIAGMLLSLIRNDWPLSDIGKAASFAVRLATLKVQREGFGGLGLDIASR
ncbi:hypothetical protein E5D57_010691 [Metarhizium anisopliae]|nr:hypothetical protein E5D57_010691 [Metarhizium anisopliae]